MQKCFANVSLLCGFVFLAYSLAGLGFLFAFIIFVLMYGTYREILSAYASGKCEVVEGIISDFHPKPAFRVKDVPFFYSDYESTPASTAPHATEDQ